MNMGVTMTAYSDRHAGTIVNFVPRMIVVQQDVATRTDNNGQCDSQTYEYRRDANGRLVTFRQRKTGRWSEAQINPDTKRWRSVYGGMGLRMGERDAYHGCGF